MRYTRAAIEEMPEDQRQFIEAVETDNCSVKITFEMQAAPREQAGITGLKPMDLLKFVMEYLRAANGHVPCNQNRVAFESIRKAIAWLTERDRDRKRRKVAGTYRK